MAMAANFAEGTVAQSGAACGCSHCSAYNK
eukprot:COSAG06_NODE_42875_length_377_cov_1.183453_1_plen_29_part_10